MGRSNNGKQKNGQYAAKIWEYMDGRMLTTRQIAELHPGIGVETLRQRLPLHTGDWKHTLRPKETAKSKAKMTFDGVTLGPRTEVTELKPPSDYEKELWGY